MGCSFSFFGGAQKGGRDRVEPFTSNIVIYEEGGGGGGGGGGKGPGSTGTLTRPVSARTVQEGFWRPGWVTPTVDPGVPAFELWPDGYTPSDVHMAHRGRVLFSKSGTMTLDDGERRRPKFRSSDPIYACAYLHCQPSRYCVGLQRQGEIWSPYHYYLYLQPSGGGSIAVYLYADDKPVCLSTYKHAVDTVVQTSGSGSRSLQKAPSAQNVLNLENRDTDVSATGQSTPANEQAQSPPPQSPTSGDLEEVDSVNVRLFHELAFWYKPVSHQEIMNMASIPLYLSPNVNETLVPLPDTKLYRRFHKLLTDMSPGEHRFRVEVRFLFDDGAETLLGYHAGSESALDDICEGVRDCLGPSEVVASGEFSVDISRKDQKLLRQKLGQDDNLL